jgi:hypothetical protein
MELLEDRCVPAILHMGAGQTYTTLSQVAAAAQNGDDIQIAAGTYSGQYATFTQSNLTIEGIGGVAHFDDTSTAISNRKGIFVIDGTNTTVRNIEFSGAHDAAGLDANWAGIRQEGATLTVDHCYFHNNDDGILTGAGSTSDILIKYSEFAHNGYGDGQSHNMYIGNVRSFTLEYSYTHDANVGHDVKSRANTNYILYNWIGDTGTGSASYELTMPNGGTAYIIGNVIRQDPDTQNSTIVDWGSEGAINPTQGVFIVNNTIINDRSGGTYIRLNGSGMPVELINNIFGGSGGGTVYSGPTAQQTTNLTAANPGFANPSSFDYHLTSGSAAIDAGSNPGSANGVSLTPTNQYVPVANTQTRPGVGALDIGAFEFGTAPAVPAAPTNLAATAGNAQVSLTWTASTGATGYKVYRGMTASSLTLLQNVGGTSLTNSGLMNGTTYYYQVTAVNAAGESGKSNQASATPQAPVTVPAAPTNLTATAGNAQVSLTWTASTGAAGYNVYRGTTASSLTLLQGTSSTSFTNTVLSNGTTYYYQVTAVNAAGESGKSNQASATPLAPPSNNGPILALDAGGAAAGSYAADTDFSGGGASSTTHVIDTSGVTGPAPQAVYQTWRYGTCTYTLPNLAAGASYTVRLDFAENVATAAGQRVFNVAINGTQVLTNFDIFAAAGGEYKALAKFFSANANGSGKITLQFTTVVGNARINGIEVFARSPVRVNAGGAVTGSFLADRFFTGGGTSSVTNAINTGGVTNPAPQSVYQTWRYGNFTYTIPNLTPGATYTVRLDFSENVATAAGQRVFDVSINGNQVLTNFDIFATAGGAFTALTEQFTAVANSSGQIVIQFTTVVGNARVSGIEIY